MNSPSSSLSSQSEEMSSTTISDSLPGQGGNRQPNSPRTHLDPNDFVIDDLVHHDQNALLAELKESVLQNIYNLPSNRPPSHFTEALADRTVFGHFKYIDADTRQLRDSYNSLTYSDLRESDSQLQPLTDEAPPSHRIMRALVEAITIYFKMIEDDVPITSQLLIFVAEINPRFRRPTHASAYITDLVQLIFESASGELLAKTAAVTKLVAGIPTVPTVENFVDFVGSNKADSEVGLLYWQFLFSLVGNRVNYGWEPAYSGSGQRWKLSMLAKISTWITGRLSMSIFDIASGLVDIDYTHNIVESGLALRHPVLGSAIVGPNSAAMWIIYEMAGCKQERNPHATVEYEIEGVFQHLLDEDKGIKTKILGIEVKEDSMVSMNNFFSKGALSKFVDWRADVRNNVMVSRNGIMLYFPSYIGPWKAMSSADGGNRRNLMKLVLRVGNGERESAGARRALEDKKRDIQSDWLSESPVSEEIKKRFRYIKNKPGRALVKLRGIRGSYGYVIAGILVVCGIVVTVMNFAERENWLERIFDGAQAASLLAGVAIVAIFFSTGTLTNTLDLLAGVAEANDIEQIGLLTGLTVEDLQGALTYARGTLYWLSEHGASYCRAVRLGSIVMTSPLRVAKNSETRHSFAYDGNGQRALWVLQGRLTRLEETGAGDGVYKVEDVPFVETVVRGAVSDDTARIGDII